MDAFQEGHHAGYWHKPYANPYRKGWSRLGIECGRDDLARQWEDGYRYGVDRYHADMAWAKAMDDEQSAA